MIKSMTGFGKAEVAIPDKKITVEIRTLNSKQLDLAVKLPSAYRPLEYEIRALAAKALQRGKRAPASTKSCSTYIIINC